MSFRLNVLASFVHRGSMRTPSSVQDVYTSIKLGFFIYLFFFEGMKRKKNNADKDIMMRPTGP